MFSDGSDLQVYSVAALLRAAPRGPLDICGCKTTILLKFSIRVFYIISLKICVLAFCFS